MRARRRAGQLENTLPIVRLWLLRILIQLGTRQQLVPESEHHIGNLGIAVGLAVDESDEKAICAKAIHRELRMLHRKAEDEAHQIEMPACLESNVRTMSDLIGMSDTDCRILGFVILLHTESLLEEVTDALGQLTAVRTFKVLSQILGMPVTEVHNALRPESALVRSGLVKIESSGSYQLRAKLDLLSGPFADYMVSEPTDPVSTLRDKVFPSSSGHLDLLDYMHIDQAVKVLIPYLRHSVTSGRRGVNIFIYGQPGTGKNQFAKALTASLGFRLFEIASEDRDGDPIYGERRLRAYRVAQNFFNQRDTVMMFDEVEDIFNDGSFFAGRKSTAENLKSWMNRMLEDNQVPTLWLSNSIDGIDNAFLRRFDMVVELPVPPKKQREQIVRNLCMDLIDDVSIARIAESEVLAPAVVSRAAAVVRTIQSGLDSAQRIKTIEFLVSNALEAQGHPPMLPNDQSRVGDLYDPLFIQSDADLSQVTAGLVSSRFGRLCLYGPPGTGKTAYGRWLAEQLSVPLHVKRGSDLMSKWVGDNEKNIARAFRNAREEKAVLLIDEVDSFLMDRRNASDSWQVSLVNEMLTQMESFPGVFIASTNLMSGLDQAALRRFDLKVRFDYLREAQAAELFRRHCVRLGFGEPGRELLSRLARSRLLTPGDFAAVFRQSRFRPVSGAEGFVTALEGECAVKEGAKPSIGFIN